MNTNAQHEHEATATPTLPETADRENETGPEPEVPEVVVFIDTKFPLGRAGITHGAAIALDEAGQSPFEFIQRHALLEQGELSDSDQRENERALKRGLRVFSSFKTAAGEKLYVITEQDRSTTTILLADEY